MSTSTGLPDAAPTDPPGSRRSGPGRPTLRRPATLVLVSALLTVLCALAFPLAPVVAPVITFSWPQPGSGTASALPLMPYEPVTLHAEASCAAVAATGEGGAVLATGPGGATPTAGLWLRRVGTSVVVASDDVVLARVPLPPRPCLLTVDSDPTRTVVGLDGRTVAEDPRDVRPTVASLATAAPDTTGLRVDLRTDTRFETTPSVLKILLGIGVAVGALGVLVGAGLADRAGGRRGARAGRRRGAGPGVGRRRPRPRPVDLVVGAGLVGWAVIGPATVDDGYIAGILRGRGQDGFTGNVFRWLDAPEAPFSWFYEVDRWWAALAPGPAASVLWLRVPATVLGLICWALLRRHALPRLGPALARPVFGRVGAPWIAAVVFASWWFAFGLSLRPEPWVATGILAVWVATERAVATGRALPLVSAALLAGFTVTLTPGALGALVPLLVALPALVRRRRRDGPGGILRPPVLLAGVVAALAATVLTAAADQSLGGLLESARVRQVIGGGQPWSEELQRYAQLLTTGSIQGALAARLPVLLLLVALPAVAWALAGRAPLGVARTPATRLLVVTALDLVLLVVSPTKWTLHFGGSAGLGTAVITLLLVCWSPRGVAAQRRAGAGAQAPVAVLGAVLLAAAFVLSGFNQWAFASDWGVFWNTDPPRVGPVVLAGVVLYGGIALVVGVSAVTAVRPRAATPAVLAPGTVAFALTAAVVVLLAGSFAKATVDRRGTFTYGEDAVAALGGDPCGLPRLLSVEPDPVAGLLTPAPGAGPVPGPVPLPLAGRTLPGWEPRPALTTGWFALPPAARPGGLPVVLAVSRPGAAVRLEFSDGAPGTDGTPAVTTAATPIGPDQGSGVRDLRSDVPGGATLVRVVATAEEGGPLAVAVPRVPRLVPFDAVVPAGQDVLSDWPVALVTACEHQPALAGGTAAVPAWRLVPPDDSDAGGISTAAVTGGPFLGPRTLVVPEVVPVYLRGDPVRDAIGLQRWVPTRPWTALTPAVGSETVAGWTRDGRATVPGLDPP